MADDERPFAAETPRRLFKIGRYEVRRARDGRYEAGTGSLGVANYRTVLGALLALRRFERDVRRGRYDLG